MPELGEALLATERATGRADRLHEKIATGDDRGGVDPLGRGQRIQVANEGRVREQLANERGALRRSMQEEILLPAFRFASFEERMYCIWCQAALIVKPSPHCSYAFRCRCSMLKWLSEALSATVNWERVRAR